MLKLLHLTTMNVLIKALENREVDVNVFQSIPYLQSEIKAHNYKFHIASKTYIFPLVARILRK